VIALQYIYTSWKNGDSSEKGYMIYAKSEGISEAECDDIKFVMQYLAPKEMVHNPTPKQIADEFPYSFSYFKLSSGRACIAQATYLGKDYSGRFGNYIIYALVIPMEELDTYPVELFGEGYIRTFLTDKELNAPSPVPALPPFEIVNSGSIINDEQVMEFIYEREEEFAYLFSAVLIAKDKGVPFYLNDTRENLVLWMAALQKMLPIEIAKQVTFNTYVGNHEKLRSDDCKAKGLTFICLGVRPDANYFSYATESKSSRQMVMDFINGNMTEDIEVLSVAKAMAMSYTMGMEDIALFSDFLVKVGFHEFNIELEAAYSFYRLYKEGDFTLAGNSLINMLEFGHKYCPEEMNSAVGVKVIEKIQAEMWNLSIEETKTLIPYLYSYSGFMVYTINEIVYEFLYEYAMENIDEGSLFDLLKSIQDRNRNEYKSFLEYFCSSKVIGQSKLYLEGNQSPSTNLFYCKFMVRNYNLRNGLNDSLGVASLLGIIIRNMAKYQSDSIFEILDEVQNYPLLLSDIVAKFTANLRADKMREFGIKFGQWMDVLGEVNASEIQSHLFKRSSQFAVYLCSMYIKESKNPDKAFWNFYNHQKSLFSLNGNLDLSTLVKAYLECDQSSKAAIKIIETVDLKLIKDISTANMIIAIIEDLPMKSLIKTEYKTLIKIDDMALSNRCETLKITAVLFAKYCERQNSITARKITFGELSSGFKYSLDGFEKKDYQEYLSEYLNIFIRYIYSSNDVTALLKSCYNTKYFGVFHDEYADILKKIKKRDERAWNRLITQTCIYLIDNISNDVAATYEPLFMKYLRKFDPEELDKIKHSVLKEANTRKTTYFFERIYEKEGLRDKFEGLFKRK
jgi:hypothetical protein